MSEDVTSDLLDRLASDEALDDFIEVEGNDEQNTLFVREDTERPDMGSEEWSDWVLSQLHEDEYPNKRPTCDGLRRIAISLFGPMDILPPIVHYADTHSAAATAQLVWPGRIISGSAEAHHNNCDPPYNQYPLATAETRAISRALKMALNLRKVITAEEGSRKADISVPITDDIETSGITDNQIRFIDLMCKQHNVSIQAAVTEAVGQHDTLAELTNVESKEVQKLLDVWSKDKPEDIAPYDPNWKTSF